MNWYEKHKAMERQASMNREANGIVMIRKRTTLGTLFETYISNLASLIKKESSFLSQKSVKLEVRGQENLGFTLTKMDLNGENIEYFADISFHLAADHVKIAIRGVNGRVAFSDNLRMYLTDDAMKLSRRISGRLGL